MEACSGAHHIGRQLAALGHDVKLVPTQYVKPFLKGHKNDYRDAEAIAEAVQRPTMSFVTIKTPAQMDLLALHRVRSRLVSFAHRCNQSNQRVPHRAWHRRPATAAPLRKALYDLLSSNPPSLSPRMVRLIADLFEDWRRLDDRIATVSTEIEALVEEDEPCQRLMTVPGIGPIISSAVVAAIGDGARFKQGRDFGAWLGLVPRQESTGDLPSSARSPSAATSTCEPYSSRLLTSSWPAGRVPQCEVYGLGSHRHRSGFTAICGQSRLPTSSPASPGQCWRAVANISHLLRLMRHDSAMPVKQQLRRSESPLNRFPAEVCEME